MNLYHTDLAISLLSVMLFTTICYCSSNLLAYCRIAYHFLRRLLLLALASASRAEVGRNPGGIEPYERPALVPKLIRRRLRTEDRVSSENHKNPTAMMTRRPRVRLNVITSSTDPQLANQPKLTTLSTSLRHPPTSGTHMPSTQAQRSRLTVASNEMGPQISNA